MEGENEKAVETIVEATINSSGQSGSPAVPKESLTKYNRALLETSPEPKPVPKPKPKRRAK